MPRSGRPALVAFPVAFLVLAATGLASDPFLASGPEDDPLPQGCGQLAPFDPDCEDPRSEPYDPDAVPSYSYLGFIGRMEITLRQDLPWGLTVKKEWECDLFLMNAPGPLFTPSQDCSPVGRVSPSSMPDLVRGYPAHVSCVVNDYSYLRTSVYVGPWGPWGCKVFMNYD